MIYASIIESANQWAVAGVLLTEKKPKGTCLDHQRVHAGACSSLVLDLYSLCFKAGSSALNDRFLYTLFTPLTAAHGP